MTIIDKIKASIQSVHTDLPVYYGDDAEVNLTTGSMTFPCAIIRLLSRGKVVRENGQLKERVSAAVFFVNLTEFDCDAEDNEDIIQDCKESAEEWLASLPLDDYIDATETDTERVYQQYDDIVTGWGILLDVTELTGYTGCTESSGDYNNDFNEDFNT